MVLSPEDEREITAVIMRYATGIDRRDYVLFRTCFADEIVAEYSLGGSTKTWLTGDAITGSMDRVHRNLGATMHRNTNIVLAREGDGARGRTYVDAILTREDGASTTQISGFYDDLFVRTDTGWKIKERRFTHVRTIETETSEAQTSAPQRTGPDWR